MSPEKRPRGARRVSAREFRRLASRAGARLSFGKPVRTGEVTVIPVARVWMAGGLGFGGERNDGGGGGGVVRSRPVGYVEASPSGTRFVNIRTPLERAALLGIATTAGALAVATAVGAVGARALVPAARAALPSARLRRRRRARRWSPPRLRRR